MAQHETRTVVERAREEAKRVYPSNHLVDDPLGETGVAESDPYGYDEVEARGFVAGATFAATITSVQIEAGARALRDGDDAYPDTYGDEDYREMVRAAARAMGFEVAEED